MIVLAIESAAELAGVALADDDGSLACSWVRGGRRHAELLVPAITHVLEAARVTLNDVGAIAVDVGPGLFTGLRVGVATAHGLARGLGVGVLGVTSTAVLARSAYDGGAVGTVVAVVDARRGEVFAARYEGPTVEVQPPTRWTPEALAAELRGLGAVVAVGGGARRYASLLGVRAVGPDDPLPDSLAAVAVTRLASGEAPVEPGTVRPLYLREPDARINWTSR